MIDDVFKKLKLLHSYNIFVGDIHSENLIYNDKGGYIVDFDEIRFKDEDDYKFMEYYTIRNNNYSYELQAVNKNSDNKKATICALSLLYNYNFEKVAKESGTDMVEFYLEAFTNNDEFKNDIHNIFNNKDEDNIIYFNEVLKSKAKVKRKD